MALNRVYIMICINGGENRYDIFINYTRGDLPVVNEFVDKFEKDGFAVWIGRSAIMSGDDFEVIIVEAIENSKVLLFFPSVSSNRYRWCSEEIGIANARGNKIIPIK